MSVALKALELEGAVARESGRHWLLKAERPEELDRMYANLM